MKDVCAGSDMGKISLMNGGLCAGGWHRLSLRPSGTCPVTSHRHRPTTRPDPKIHRFDIRMSCLELSKLRSMPLAFATTQMYTFADYGVTEFMVEYRSDPPASRGLKEFPSHRNLTSSDIARRKHALLPTTTPRDMVGIELLSIGKVLLPEIHPYLEEERIVDARVFASWSCGRNAPFRATAACLP